MRVLDIKDFIKFHKNAEEYKKLVTESKETARETLVSLGIYTKDGKLTDNYK